MSVATAGDLNRDGFEDILSGAMQSKIGGEFLGRAYVFSGRTGDKLQTFTGDSARAGFGISVAGVGDLDNDGIPELLIGEMRRSSRLYSCSCGNDMSFRAGADGWQFANTRAQMWPKTWWKQFDYSAAEYPVWLRAWAQPSDFPSWPRFVDAFGDAQCYWDPPPGAVTYRIKSLLRWNGIKGPWGGSCFGFAVSSLLYFDDSLSLWADYPGHLYVNDVPLDDDVRKTLNTYWIHQFGQIDKRWTRAHWSDKPSTTVAECAKMFCDPYNPHRALTLFNNNVSGGHTIVPYRLAPDSHYVNSVDIFVYDNNYPGIDTLKVIVDTLTNYWYYSGLPGWSGFRHLFLENPVGDYMTRPALTGPNRVVDSPPKIAAGADATFDLMECYLTPSDTAILVSPYGRIGRLGDSLFNTLSEGFPIIPLTGRETPPLGYYIPNSTWSVRTTGSSDSRLRVTFLADSTVLVYSRDSVAANDADSICYRGDDGGLGVYNTQGDGRSCSVELLSAVADSEVFCRLTNIVIGPADSSLFVPGGHGNVFVHNYGPATSYNLGVEVASALTDTVFYHGAVLLSANTSHDIRLDWRSHQGSLMVLVDAGMNGTFGDTLWLTNTGESPCPCVCRADPKCDGIHDMLDIVVAIDIAFRNAPLISDPDAQCAFDPADVDCDGVTNLIDVVKLIDVVFRGGDPAVHFCDTCGP